MQRLSQRIALVTGALCLGVGLSLVGISHLSSRYILEQQRDEFAESLLTQLTREVAPAIAQNDLIRLEANLRVLRERHGLQMIAVTDLEERPLGQAGEPLTSDSVSYSGSLTIDDHIAGELTITYADDPALVEQQRMTLGLLFLAILSSLFAGALAGRWGQTAATRLAALRERLAPGAPEEADELAALEKAVESLPLDLLLPVDSPGEESVDFEEAGLLFIRLESLTRYVETLDEHSLVKYTQSLRELIDKVAGLYGGQLSVSREFGALLFFSGAHAAGNPGFRSVSSAWLLQRLAGAASAAGSLNYQLGVACGTGEAGRPQGAPGAAANLYTDLYNQHIIDDLAILAETPGDGVYLNATLAEDQEVRNRCKLAQADRGWLVEGFEEPYSDLLERQLRLLMNETGAGAANR